MMRPKRGEIWWANLNPDGRGAELSAKKDANTQRNRPDRPVLIVSDNEYNMCPKRNRLTVAPLMNYNIERRELDINWGFKVPHSITKKEYSSCFNLKRDYENSFIDCGYLTTLDYVFVPNQRVREKMHGVFHDGYTATIPSGMLLNLSNALQIALGDNIKSTPHNSPIKFGDVIVFDAKHEIKNKHNYAWLVTSSTGVDLLRYSTIRRRSQGPENDDLRFSIVCLVMLEKANFEDEQSEDVTERMAIEQNEINSDTEKHDAEDDKSPLEKTTVKINVAHNDEAIQWIAHCHELHTFDWLDRNAQIIGGVSREDMRLVCNAMGRYLNVIPLQ